MTHTVSNTGTCTRATPYHPSTQTIHKRYTIEDLKYVYREIASTQISLKCHTRRNRKEMEPYNFNLIEINDERFKLMITYQNCIRQVKT